MSKRRHEHESNHSSIHCPQQDDGCRVRNIEGESWIRESKPVRNNEGYCDTADGCDEENPHQLVEFAQAEIKPDCIR